MGLIEKANNLDKFLNDRHLEKDFTQAMFDYHGLEYDGKSINIKSYIQTYKPNVSTEEAEITEVEMIFEES